MSTTKVGENITNILKLLFFTINLHFVVSKQISRTSSVYLVFLPLEVQRRLQQTKVYHEFSHFVWKETTRKPLKVTSAKTLFSNVFVIYTTCFDEWFLFCVITGRHYFSWKIKVTLRFFKAPWCYFLWSQCFMKSVFHALSPE